MTEDKKKKSPPTIEELEAEGRTPWKPAPPADQAPGYPGPLELYFALRKFYEDWLYFPDIRLYDVLTAWTLHTWHYRKFRSSPPLFLVGPISSGKTTVLECLEETAYRGTRGGSMSTSTMFRLSQWAGPTLLVDEAQMYNRDEWEECRDFLNERYRKSGKVWRVEAQDDGYVPKYFDAYGPTALAGSESSWEAMISRAIVISMEKGKPNKKTLTEEFYQQGARLRYWLKCFSEKFEPNVPHEGDETLDPVIDKMIRDGKLQRSEPDHFPPADVTRFDDGRMQEKAEPVIACSPVGDPRNAVIAFALDMERRQKKNEESSYLVEYLQAFLAAPREHGRVGSKEIRREFAIMRGYTRTAKRKENGEVLYYDEPDINAKGMPSQNRITKCMETLGFERDRMPNGERGFTADPALEKRLRERYNLGKGPGLSGLSGGTGETTLIPDTPGHFDTFRKIDPETLTVAKPDIDSIMKGQAQPVESGETILVNSQFKDLCQKCWGSRNYEKLGAKQQGAPHGSTCEDCGEPAGFRARIP